MQDFNPVLFNCILLYLTVVLLSILQSRFRIIKDNPTTFIILFILAPLIGLGKAAKLKTWTSITGIEIWFWTLMMAYFNPRRIVPRINEGYIYAYTLFHWYLLFDTIYLKGLNFWILLVIAISLYPTFLIIKASLEFSKLDYRSKLILYYWFLFVVTFTYIDQIALDIIKPILALYEVYSRSTLYVLITGTQLYFIATSISLLFVSIPIFHLDQSSDKWKIRWQRAKKEWRRIVNYELGNYVEYQISLTQFIYITFISAALFFIDHTNNFRLYLIFIYTVLFPIIFFYFKLTPDENLEENEA